MSGYYFFIFVSITYILSSFDIAFEKVQSRLKFSITPSFLEEFFTNIVKEYGIEKFRETVHIEPNGYNIEVPLEEALDRILQDKTALQK